MKIVLSGQVRKVGKMNLPPRDFSFSDIFNFQNRSKISRICLLFYFGSCEKCNQVIAPTVVKHLAPSDQTIIT